MLAESNPEFIYRPTIIVVHPRENRRKCSVEPLRGKSGFKFQTFSGQQPLDLDPTQHVRLGLGGPLLSPADMSYGLVILDGTWRWAAAMEKVYSAIPVRSLPPWKTAYPRVSKVFEDPAAGLATIEALFAAYQALGRPTDTLLDQYQWKTRFLELNQELLGQPAAVPDRSFH